MMDAEMVSKNFFGMQTLLHTTPTAMENADMCKEQGFDSIMHNL